MMHQKTHTQPDDGCWMNLRRNVLWVDGLAGSLVGALVLLLSGRLSDLHHLPHNFILFMGGVNLLYGSYSLTLASRSNRPLAFIKFLVAANGAWAVVCLVCATVFWQTASPFGLAHLLGEAIFVGALGFGEWRWRDFLRTA